MTWEPITLLLLINFRSHGKVVLQDEIEVNFLKITKYSVFAISLFVMITLIHKIRTFFLHKEFFDSIHANFFRSTNFFGMR